LIDWQSLSFVVPDGPCQWGDGQERGRAWLGSWIDAFVIPVLSLCRPRLLFMIARINKLADDL